MYITGLIALITGFILGILTMKLKTKHFKKKYILQENILKKNTKKIHEYQQELNNHFDTSIELLNIIANDYQKLYQHIIESSNVLITKQDTQNPKNNLFHQNNKNYMNVKNSTSQYITEVPRDYPDNNNNSQ